MTAATIFALSSGSPPAAISVIRISGPQAHEAGGQLAGSLPPSRQAGVRSLRDADGLLLDEALVLRFDGPATSTGEDTVELHCHGGRAIVTAVLAALAAQPGLRQAEPGEFTRRAFGNGRIDLTQAEGLADLIEAETETQRRAALAVAEGGLSRQIAIWQDRLLQLSAQAEAAIDYVEEDSVDAYPTLNRECEALAIELEQWLARPMAEPLKDGLLVVLAGPPNAGKSSLLNALVGYERAIVADIPGTTRDHIEVGIALDGIPIRLTDTAGIRNSADVLEIEGVARANRLVQQSDILVWLGEPTEAPAHDHLIRIHARSDLSERASSPVEFIPVSVRTGLGLGDLHTAIVEHARRLLPVEGVLAVNARQAARIRDAAEALRRASSSDDIVLQSEDLRSARAAFGRLTGQAGVEDVLDALFGRFCLGK
ncbi:tRNA uridine-5-carboxymethylaminomethyl(34) synthesis GTPase MnmE [Sphingomonas sabuli]|uniref:tRNA modification GTPase MnmE n=1 Tax=Sphingomonas sabuli TaxID=2764186 RepID=A0A7G9L0E6_9SPHN|nr:tRNA uridine-5-carboxymethylaminomethyl(34) synthesis GTPase MnmE [Sphingomonas sabuli]QNM82095.1 tRNA uridine-5-carboxymethylaminomethyl(34) synthesis GTPase MnmE [Sphingomonas sabuli]